MADVEQSKKVIPFVTCEVSFGQSVCDLVFGVTSPNLNLGVQIDSVKQPIKRNSVGSWHMSHCWTPAFDYHLDHGFIVLEHVQHSNWLRKSDIRRHIINMKQLWTTVHGWSFRVTRCHMFPCAEGPWSCWVGFGRNEIFLQPIPKIPSWDTVHS